MKHVFCIYLFTLFVFFLVAQLAWGQETITLTTADNQSHYRAKAMNAVLTACFEKMGKKVTIVPMPSKRSLVNANNGEEDGIFVRTVAIDQIYAHLLRVPERISVDHIVAFSTRSDIGIDGWKSLLSYHVAYVNGWRICERELVQAKEKTIVKNDTLLFTLLHKNRADLGIFGLSIGLERVKHLGYKNIHPLQPPVITSDLYLYMHKKYRHLIPEIATTLQAMKKSGPFQGFDQYGFRLKEGS